MADAQATNLEACAGVALVSRNATAALLRVSARHGYGTLDLSVSVHDALVTITVADARAWRADPVERHLGFGEWWTGLLTNSTASIVMGRLQGPRATPGPTAIAGAPSAGFITLSRRGYYRYLFYAEEGDAVAFTACPTPEVAAIVAAAAPPEGAPLSDARRTAVAVDGDDGDTTDG